MIVKEMKNIVLFIGVLAQFFILNSCEQSEEVGKKIIEEESGTITI